MVSTNAPLLIPFFCNRDFHIPRSSILFVFNRYDTYDITSHRIVNPFPFPRHPEWTAQPVLVANNAAYQKGSTHLPVNHRTNTRWVFLRDVEIEILDYY